MATSAAHTFHLPTFITLSHRTGWSLKKIFASSANGNTDGSNSNAVSYSSIHNQVVVPVISTNQIFNELCSNLYFLLSLRVCKNIGVFDNFLMAETYKEVMTRVTFNEQMGSQLTFLRSKSVAYNWHRGDGLTFPDENCKSFGAFFVVTCSSLDTHKLTLIASLQMLGKQHVCFDSFFMIQNLFACSIAQ